MLRESNMQTLTCADKTMSLMKERQLEACEDRLSSLPNSTCSTTSTTPRRRPCGNAALTRRRIPGSASCTPLTP